MPAVARAVRAYAAPLARPPASRGPLRLDRGELHPAVQLLERDHGHLTAAARADGPLRGAGAAHGGDAGDSTSHRGAANLVAVGARARAGRGVDHHLDLAGVDALD